MLVSFPLVFIGMVPTGPKKLLTIGDYADVRFSCSDELVAHNAKPRDYDSF